MFLMVQCCSTPCGKCHLGLEGVSQDPGKGLHLQSPRWRIENGNRSNFLCFCGSKIESINQGIKALEFQKSPGQVGCTK